MSKPIVLVGGAGFIGVSLAEALVRLEGPASNHTIISRATNPIQRPSHLTLDMVDTDLLAKAIPEDAIVYLLAWDSSPATAGTLTDPANDPNVRNHIRLLELLASKHRGRIVFLSSGGAVYGEPESLPIPETHALNPISAYGAAKKHVEGRLASLGREHGLDYTIARASNPYGGGQVVKRGQGLIAAIKASIIDQTALRVWGDGSAVRDYLHITDTADALALVGTKAAASGQILNIGSGNGTSIAELVGMIERAIGGPLEIHYDPKRSVDVTRNILDISKISALLNWSPRITLERGLEEIFTPLWRR
jgi:UDP-glucose 4-epimerase